MIARLLHGFGALDRTIAQRCCGRRWRDLPRHRQFSHGETLLGWRHERGTVPHFGGETLAALPCSEPGCAEPASGWVYQTMSDGQTINGRSVCLDHLVTT